MKRVDENNVNKAFLEGLEPGVERALLRILTFHVGSDQAIVKEKLIADLKKHGFVVEERVIRALINDLRKRGHLICSKGGAGGGYWLAGSREEMEEFLEREVHSRAMDLLEQEKALRSAMVERWGDAVQGMLM